MKSLWKVCAPCYALQEPLQVRTVPTPRQLTPKGGRSALETGRPQGVLFPLLQASRLLPAFQGANTPLGCITHVLAERFPKAEPLLLFVFVQTWSVLSHSESQRRRELSTDSHGNGFRFLRPHRVVLRGFVSGAHPGQ